MDQLICASLSHTHCWYEVGMLKVPADASQLSEIVSRGNCGGTPPPRKTSDPKQGGE